MTTYTPFLRLAKPPFDSMPWDEAINSDMDTIDAFIQRYMAVPNYMGSWTNSTAYISGQNVLDITNAIIYQCAITHTSSATPTTFAQDRTTYPTYWIATQNVITGGAGNTVLTIAEATPLTAKAGDLWWDSLGGQLYVMYNDGNSLQWVIANNQSGMVGEAPNDGSVYGRRMSAWTPISQGNVGRNLIHNSMFNIAQRGAGPFTTAAYTLDRWALSFAGGSSSVSVPAMLDAHRAAIGDEAAAQYLQNNFVGATGANLLNIIYQRIEGVRRLSGKTVTVSFWAAAASGTPKIGLSLDQAFGTGGSPSSQVNGTGQSVTISTTFTRYSLTFTLPSTAGMTLGTNNDSTTTLIFWYSADASLNARSGSVGVQTAIISLWGVQLEITQPGQTQPTLLEKLDPELQLRQCQRFFLSTSIVFGSYQLAANNIYAPIVFPTTMRATPGFVLSNVTNTNCTGPIAYAPVPQSVAIYITATASGAASSQFNLAISADL